MKHSKSPHMLERQRGAALLMAMVIVTVVATIASSMVWQQWRAVQVESAERDREQSEWLLVGALDFARMVLIDAGRQVTTGGQPQATHLGQQWAQDLKEMRLSTFLAVDKDNTDDAPDAFLSGKVVDVNARYNLRSLLAQSATSGVVVDPQQLKVLTNLFTYINVPPTLANQIADALSKASLAAMDTQQSFAALGGASGRAAAPVMLQRLDQLTWLLPKLGADTVERMRPYVTLLPYDPQQTGPTNININTAPKEVIAAVWGIDTSTAERIVRSRQGNFFDDVAEAQKQVPTVPMPAEITVNSEYFEVTGALRLENQIMRNRHLVKRSVLNPKQVQVIVLNQERFSGVDSGN
jgi:general secretion pathway protein K